MVSTTLCVTVFLFVWWAVVRWLGPHGRMPLDVPRAAAVFLALSLFATLWHLFRLAEHTLASAPFSGSQGTSFQMWSRLGLNEWTTQLRVEPALCFLAGVILLVFTNWFGIYLIIAACALGDQGRYRFAVQLISDTKHADAFKTNNPQAPLPDGRH